MGAPKTYDVVGIGSAIVDVSAAVDDNFLVSHELVKGTMALIDVDGAAALRSSLTEPTLASGGSTSNTMAGLASFGGVGAFVGKVADDDLGHRFVEEMGSIGVDFLADPASGTLPTAQSIVLVTPDAQRTLNTYLGVAGQLCEDDVPLDVVAGSKVLFTEGYMWDSPSAKQAVEAAAAEAKAHGVAVAFSLSDPLCVDRHRSEFADFLSTSVDIVFGNADEVASVYQADDETSLQLLGQSTSLAFITKGAEGSVVLQGEQRTLVDAFTLGDVVDTTGAGDQYAAGVLYGLTHGKEPAQAARLGSLAGAEAVTHMGPRPLVKLADLAADNL